MFGKEMQVVDISCPNKSPVDSQEIMLLEYLREHGKATTMSIVQDLGFCSPTKLISKLRRHGAKIVDRWETGTNRYGNDCRYKVYELED